MVPASRVNVILQTTGLYMKINADNHTLPHIMPHTGGGLDHATSHEACIRFQNLNLDLGAGCAQDETIKKKNPEVP